jgi:hypothetical protein
LFVYEADMLSDLLAVAIRGAMVVSEDVWSWTLSRDGRYSVKSAYSSLLKGLQVLGIPQGEVLQAVSRVWKSWAPSKVIVFPWQFLLDRIPSRSNLLRRGVPLPAGGVGCIFCPVPLESATHCFLYCPSVFPMWYQVYRWLGWEFVMPHGITQLFQAFTGLGRGMRVKLVLLLVWHTVIWTIWASQNYLIFAGGLLREEPVVDRAKLLAWKWFRASTLLVTCNSPGGSWLGTVPPRHCYPQA